MGNGTGDYEKYNLKKKTYYQRKDEKYSINRPSTNKQRKFVKDMLDTCKRCGIDTSWIRFNLSTKAGCSRVIGACRTLLTKNGYDWYGNKKEETE